MAQLTEEVGEVASIIARRYGEQSEKNTDKKGNKKINKKTYKKKRYYKKTK